MEALVASRYNPTTLQPSTQKHNDQNDQQNRADANSPRAVVPAADKSTTAKKKDKNNKENKHFV
ncbi:hypothetical protein BH09VER1_BH09VER1_52970 [soil metagenome]